MKTRRSHPARLATACALAMLLSATPSVVRAASLTWDSGGVGANNGSNPAAPVAAAGTWNTINSNWSNGTSDSVWNNANGDAAIFGAGSAYTVTIAAGGVTIGNGGGTGGLTAGTAGAAGTVTLQTGPITLSGGTVTFATPNTSSNLTINSAIGGSANVAITGINTTFGAANTYTGTTTVSSGNLRTTVANALPSTTALTLSTNTTLYMFGNNQQVASLAGAGTVANRSNNSGTLTVDGTATTTFSGGLNDILASTSSTALINFTKRGTGTLTLSGATGTYGGITTVSGGTLIAGANALATTFAGGSAATVDAATDTITLNNGLVAGDKVVFNYTTVPTGLAYNTQYFVINPTATTFQVSSTLNGAAINITAAGANVKATQYLPSPFGSTNNAIVLGDASTASNNSSASLLTGGAFTIGRAVTVANQATSGTYTIGGNTANTSAFTGLVTANQSLTVFQAASGTLNISGGITGASAGTKTVTFNNAGSVNVNTTGISDGATGNVAVIQSGAGTTTLNAANTYTGDTTISAGTLTFGTGSSLLFTLGDGSATNQVLGTGAANFNGTFKLGLGAVTDSAGTWNLVNTGTLTESFAGTFAVTDNAGVLSFTETTNIWTSNDRRWSFNESTGVLTLSAAIPEPSAYAALVGAALLGYAALRRRSRR